MSSPATGFSASALEGPHWTDDKLAVWSIVSWKAILFGTVVAIATQALLSLLGAGIGFSLVDDPTATQQQIARAALGVGLWWIVTSVIAVYVGAWSASEITPPGTERAGALQGIGVWALATVIAALLAGPLAAHTPVHAMTSDMPSLRSPAITYQAVPPRREAMTPEEQQRAKDAAKAAALASFMLFVGGALGVIAAGFGGTHNRKHRLDLHRNHFDATRRAL